MPRLVIKIYNNNNDGTEIYRFTTEGTPLEEVGNPAQLPPLDYYYAGGSDPAPPGYYVTKADYRSSVLVKLGLSYDPEPIVEFQFYHTGPEYYTGRLT